ncbi:MAG: DUF4405 domain-containing protein [Desulfobulbaceae bacterium]
MQGGFHARSFVSVFSFGSFLLMTVTGVVLYFVPEGRVAYWTDWRLLGLSKTQWGDVHIVSSLLFGVAGLVHLYLNWSPFWAYLTKKVGSSLRYGKEAALAGILSVFLLVGTLSDVPPLSSIVDLGKTLKASWVKDRSYEPPFGHAELVSLKVLAKKEGFDLEAGLEALRGEEIVFDSEDQKLLDVARRNAMSPREVYAVLTGGSEGKKDGGAPAGRLSPEEVEAKYAGTGIGRKRLAWVLEDLGLTIEEARTRFSRHGIDFDPEATLKEIGEQAGYDPIELLLVLVIPEYTPKKDR